MAVNLCLLLLELRLLLFYIIDLIVDPETFRF